MYDYLAKIILLGPSGSGKFVKEQASQGRSLGLRIDQVLSSSPICEA